MLALGLIVLVGAALRITWGDVTVYGTDEAEYVGTARTLSADPTRYGALVRGFVATPERWGLPLPTRWGSVALTTAACVVAPCTPRTLAWLETLAGIAAIGLTYAVARTLLGVMPALLAAAFTVTSPIQLGMGRRALEDELFVVAVLLAMWSTLRLVGKGGSRGDSFLIVVAALAAYTFAFAVKETFILYYPALAAFLLIARGSRRPRLGDIAVFALAPVLYAGVLGLLTGDPLLVQMLPRIDQAVRASPYVLQYQSGPFYEPFVDVYVLAPLVTLAAFAAGAAAARRSGTTENGAGALVAFGVLLLAVYALMPKDARYFIPADATARMLAAWCVFLFASVRRELAVATVGIALLNGMVELPIFNAVFLRGEVYDPVLANLLHPLGMTP